MGHVAASMPGGVAPARIAVAIPVLVVLAIGVLAIGVTEIGRVIDQAANIQRGLRAGARVAAGHSSPLPRAVVVQVENVVKTGDPAGSARYLVPGWAMAGAAVQVQELDFRVAGSSAPVVRISVTVPFDPLFPGLLPIPAFNIELSHDQVLMAD